LNFKELRNLYSFFYPTGMTNSEQTAGVIGPAVIFNFTDHAALQTAVLNSAASPGLQ
jgi:hypothetical protein